MTDNSGLKVGLGMAAVGTTCAYSLKPTINKLAKKMVNYTRSETAQQNENIKLAEEAIKNVQYENIMVRNHTAKVNNEIIQTANKIKNTLYEQTRNIFNLRRSLKNINLLKPVLVAASLCLGCGVIVDRANKKQRANSDPNAITENGNQYTKVNMGKKLGAILGATVYSISALINKGAMKKILASSPNKVISVAIAMGINILGGLTLGAIADKISNKKAAKEADEIAYLEQ